MSIERALSVIGARHWDEIKGSWVSHMGSIPSKLEPPDPGLEKLRPLQTAELQDRETFADLPGVRANALAEALFLYHKAAHAQLAVARLSGAGMTSWSMFNAYHSAFLNAKAVMALLGVAFPKIQGGDCVLDIFPVPDKRRNNKQWKMKSSYDSILYAKLPGRLDQRYVWQALKRCTAMTMGAWDGMKIVDSMKALNWERVTPPRNKFLYTPAFWPALGDLTDDITDAGWDGLLQGGLDPESTGFLLSLSFEMCQMSGWLFGDIAKDSNLFAKLISPARWPDPAVAENWGASLAFEQRAAA